ncbi:MAG: PAS domain S-box protein [Planctomycetes bacterium]|nr:PAS domain S-box protein [Planctomycetota bacterium]
MIEDRSRSLFVASAELVRSNHVLERILDTMNSALVVLDERAMVQRVNRATTELTGWVLESTQPVHVSQLLDLAADANVDAVLAMHTDVELRTKGGEAIPVHWTVSPTWTDDGVCDGAVCIAVDMREKRRLEIELRHAHKLESVGQLAAGVAHEVNTPIQFTGDSVHFLQDAFGDISRLIARYEELRLSLTSSEDGVDDARINAITTLRDEIDFDFLTVEVPAAVSRALDGVDRVATIVGAMKAFAHPGSTEKLHQDINAAIQTTLEVCRNEYKYVADMDLQLGQIPLVHCNLSDINQVVLNLVVNAAHAIRDSLGKCTHKGRITIGTLHDGKDVVIAVRDTGGGIPIEIRERVFDPFFTTKDVGVGTGQGLAIAHRIVTEDHGGTIRFETVVGEGTTFEIRLPVDAVPDSGENEP